MNWYTYAGNNPLSRLDPTGLTSKDVNILEKIYQNYWNNLDEDFYKDPDQLVNSLAVMFLGSLVFDESAMPTKGWGMGTDHVDKASMNQVRAIQAALQQIKVDGKYGPQTLGRIKQLYNVDEVSMTSAFVGKLLHRAIYTQNDDFIWPVENPILTSAFGPRKAPETSLGPGSTNHTGWDIIGDSNILASAAGTVIESGWHELRGWYVLIDHGRGRMTRYNHLREPPQVVKGQDVFQGQIIGIMGSTGSSTGIHLHLTYLINSIPTDPINILPYSSNTPVKYPVTYDSNKGTYINKY